LAKKRSILRSNLGILAITSGMWTFGGSMVNPFWGLYVLFLGGSPFHIGLISAVSSALALLPSMFGGYLADRLSRKKMVYGLQVLLALNTFIYIFARSWVWLLVARSFDAIISGFRNPAFSAFLADSTRAEERVRNYGIWNTVPPLFGLISPYLIGIFMDKYGVIQAQRWAYVVLMIVTSVTAYIRYRYLEETAPTTGRLDINPSHMVRETLRNFKETIKVLSHQTWALILLGAFYQFGVSLISLFMVTYAVEDVIHISSSDWGLINTISTVLVIFTSLPFAMLAERVGKRRLILVSLFTTPFAILGFIFSPRLPLVLLSFSILTVLGSMGSVASQALFTDYFPRTHRGRINALTSVVGSTQSFSFLMAGGGVVGSLGNIVGGLLYGKVSYASPFILMAAVIIATALFSLRYVFDPKKQEE
jgi:MFS family permease